MVPNDDVTQVVPGTLVLWLGFRLVVTFKTTKLYSAAKRLIRSLWKGPCTFVLLKATCSPNPNPRTSGRSLAGHLVFPHEPILPLNLLDLIFFYNIITIIIIYIRVYTYIRTQWIHNVKLSTQHSITKIVFK